MHKLYTEDFLPPRSTSITYDRALRKRFSFTGKKFLNVFSILHTFV